MWQVGQSIGSHQSWMRLCSVLEGVTSERLNLDWRWCLNSYPWCFYIICNSFPFSPCHPFPLCICLALNKQCIDVKYFLIAEIDRQDGFDLPILMPCIVGNYNSTGSWKQRKTCRQCSVGRYKTVCCSCLR